MWKKVGATRDTRRNASIRGQTRREVKPGKKKPRGERNLCDPRTRPGHAGASSGARNRGILTTNLESAEDRKDTARRHQSGQRAARTARGETKIERLQKENSKIPTKNGLLYRRGKI